MIVHNNILSLQLYNDLTTTKHWVCHLDHTQKDDEAYPTQSDPDRHLLLTSAPFTSLSFSLRFQFK